MTDMTGHVVAWDVVDALRNPAPGPRESYRPTEVDSGLMSFTALPAIYTCVSQSQVQSIAVARVPHSVAAGEYDYSGDPIYLVIGSYDGTASFLDLRDTQSVLEIVSTRSEFRVYPSGMTADRQWRSWLSRGQISLQLRFGWIPIISCSCTILVV